MLGRDCGIDTCTRRQIEQATLFCYSDKGDRVRSGLGHSRARSHMRFPASTTSSPCHPALSSAASIRIISIYFLYRFHVSQSFGSPWRVIHLRFSMLEKELFSRLEVFDYVLHLKVALEPLYSGRCIIGDTQN